jgi:hypothetical protein
MGGEGELKMGFACGHSPCMALDWIACRTWLSQKQRPDMLLR